MNIKSKKIIFAVILICFTFDSHSQVSFLGKKRTFNLASSLTTHRQAENILIDNGEINYDFSVLPPILELDFGNVITSRINFSCFFSWNGLRNAHLKRSFLLDSESTSEFYEDQLKVRTNAWSTGIEFSFFNEYAPVGKYITLRFGYKNAYGKLYPDYFYEYYDKEFQITKTVVSAEEPVNFTNGYLFSSIGFGKSMLISQRFISSLGIRMNFHRSLNKEKSYSPISLSGDDFNEELNLMLNKNIRNSLIPEVYVKIGFIK